MAVPARSRGEGSLLRQRRVAAHAAQQPAGAKAWRGVAQWMQEESREKVEATVGGITKGFVDYWRARRKDPSSDKEPDYLKEGRASREVLKDAVKYGEMVQAVYDTLLTKNVYSVLFGRCCDGAMVPGEQLKDMERHLLVGPEAGEYRVKTQIEADSGAYKLVVKEGRNYVGIIAQGPPDADGAVDIAIVFRGTITRDEWIQDAKALKVRWASGQQVAKVPSTTITSSPFIPNIQLSLASFLVATLLLSSSVAEKLPAAPGPLAVARDALTGLLAWLGVSSAGVLSDALATAVVVFLVSGVLGGILKNADEWLSNVVRLARASVEWAVFLSKTILDGIFMDRSDPRVSYGFKEMYCDSMEGGSQYECGGAGAADCSAPLPPAPRLTVFKTLVELLREEAAGKLKIKSITTTGHSLGGALASMCAFDLSRASSAALPITDADKARAARVPKQPAEGETSLLSMYDLTLQTRFEYIRLLQARGSAPAVAAVTFASPRVGDNDYTHAFKSRTLESPLNVMEPVWDPSYQPGAATRAAMLFRDTLPQLTKMPWYWVGAAQMLSDRSNEQARNAPANMLRIVNAHDVVPKLPFTLPLPGLFYVHGGYQLSLNSLFIPYFKASHLTGATVGARHNMEMYLHLLDPTRDVALCNKSDDILEKELRIPPCWWEPEPNNGMTLKDGKWVPPK